jgi:homoserine kinase
MKQGFGSSRAAIVAALGLVVLLALPETYREPLR